MQKIPSCEATIYWASQEVPNYYTRTRVFISAQYADLRHFPVMHQDTGRYINIFR